MDEFRGLVRETLAHHSAVRRSAAPTLRRPPDDAPAEQLRRILHLIPALADGEPHRIQDLVWDVGVDRSLLLQDLQSITERFEVPGGFVEGLQIYLDADTLCVVPNHFLRPDAAHPGRAVRSGAGAGDAPEQERPREERRAIGGARHRLESVIAKLPDEEIAGDLRYATLSAAGDLEHLRRLREAFRQRRRVRLRYRKAAEEKSSVRIICPTGIVFASGMWYAVAVCDAADEVRIFRLDRIEEVELLDAKFDPPKDERGRDHSPGGPGLPGTESWNSQGALFAPDRALDRRAGREAAGARTARSRWSTRWPTPTGRCATCSSTVPKWRCSSPEQIRTELAAPTRTHARSWWRDASATCSASGIPPTRSMRWTLTSGCCSTTSPSFRAGKVNEEDVHVWWGKVKSKNRLEQMPHLAEILAMDAELADQGESGREMHLYLTDYRSLYVGHVYEITAENVTKDEAGPRAGLLQGKSAQVRLLVPAG